MLLSTTRKINYTLKTYHISKLCFFCLPLLPSCRHAAADADKRRFLRTCGVFSGAAGCRLESTERAPRDRTTGVQRRTFAPSKTLFGNSLLPLLPSCYQTERKHTIGQRFCVTQQRPITISRCSLAYLRISVKCRHLLGKNVIASGDTTISEQQSGIKDNASCCFFFSLLLLLLFI